MGPQGPTCGQKGSSRPNGGQNVPSGRGRCRKTGPWCPKTPCGVRKEGHSVIWRAVTKRGVPVTFPRSLSARKTRTLTARVGWTLGCRAVGIQGSVCGGRFTAWRSRRLFPGRLGNCAAVDSESPSRASSQLEVGFGPFTTIDSVALSHLGCSECRY